MAPPMVHALWPLFDLRLRTDRLELRLPTDDELAMLCLIAMEGIHDPGEMPFGYPWTKVPSPRFEREFAQFHWVSGPGGNPTTGISR